MTDRAIFQALPDLALRLDQRGVILDINAAAAARWPDQNLLVGTRIQDTPLTDVAARFAESLEPRMPANAVLTIEFSDTHAGQQTHHEARLVPLPGRDILVLIRDITERKLTETALRESDGKFRQMADNITDVFWIRSPDMQEVHYVSPAFERIWGRPVPNHYGNPQNWVSYIVPEDREWVARVFAGLTADTRSLDVEYRIMRPDGDIRWIRARGFQVRDAQDRLIRNTGIVTDITDRKRAQAELDAVQQQLLETSRRAGMAEIATNVLHNVGNILNSVNVSAGLVRSTLRTSRAKGLAQAIELLGAHAADLGAFLENDEKGRMLPGYLAGVAQALQQEQQGMALELEHLSRSIDHIKEVVTTQQSHAGRIGRFEPVLVSDLVDDALRMNAAALEREQVLVAREFAQMAPARLDRARVLQILVNLISNASNALRETPAGSRRLSVQIALADGAGLRVCVTDNGEGIAADNLGHIFSHGFTTRRQGHGFGLHSSALAATQMGGTLAVHSEGPGRGASFTLELPFHPMHAP